MAKEGQDSALSSNGCTVSYASCKHELAKSDNIIDGSRTTFWATTGLYPHHFTLTFPLVININGITIRSYYVKKMLIEKSTRNETTDFEEIKSFDLQLTDLHHQVTELKFDNIAAHHLRFHVKEGYEEFCAIYKVEVFGDAPKGDERLIAMPVTSATGTGFGTDIATASGTAIGIGSAIGTTPMRTTASLVSAAQVTGRHSLIARQPQGLRTMQSTTSAGLAENAVTSSIPTATSRPPPTMVASPLQPNRISTRYGNQGALPSQPHTPVTPSSTSRESDVRNMSDLNTSREEDW